LDWCEETVGAWNFYGFHWFWESYCWQDDNMCLLNSDRTLKPFVEILQRFRDVPQQPPYRASEILLSFLKYWDLTEHVEKTVDLTKIQDGQLVSTDGFSPFGVSGALFYRGKPFGERPMDMIIDNELVETFIVNGGWWVRTPELPAGIHEIYFRFEGDATPGPDGYIYLPSQSKKFLVEIFEVA
jgi:hypothetical protein